MEIDDTPSQRAIARGLIWDTGARAYYLFAPGDRSVGVLNERKDGRIILNAELDYLHPVLLAIRMRFASTVFTRMTTPQPVNWMRIFVLDLSAEDEAFFRLGLP